MPRYEFKQGTSNKFWEIELSGNSYTTTYGKIGTDGKSTTKDYPDAEKAAKEYEKAIKSKTKKGYQLVGEGGAEAGGEGDGKSPIVGLEKESDVYSNAKKFIFRTVKEYKEKPGLTQAKKGVAYRLGYGYDDGQEEPGTVEEFVEILGKMAADPHAGELEALVIGQWDEEMFEVDPEAIVSFLVENANTFSNLQALFIGDLTGEECEMSWIQQCDYAPLLKAFPKLEHLRIRGATRCGKLASNSLRSLTVQCAVPAAALRNICTADLPELEHLELWIGTPDYDGDASADDLLPLLSGKSFPKLRYLGLRNAQIADDIAVALSDAPIVERLHTLDLSLGVLTDRGAEALAASPAVPKLQRLDVHHHYIGDAALKKLKDLGVPTFNGSREEAADDPEYRYVSVGE